jgi:hypothetical protein
MKTTLYLLLIICLSAIGSMAQPRPFERTAAKSAAAPLPAAVTAKYEGGMFGFSKKMAGTLKFDDINSRLVFFGEDQKELFGLPYESFLVVYPQSKAVTSTAGNVISHIPLPGAGLAGFIKEKRRYLIVQFSDPDVDVKGVVNFKLEDKETLDAIIQVMAEKAGLQQRGDAYYKPKAIKKDT